MRDRHAAIKTMTKTFEASLDLPLVRFDVVQAEEGLLNCVITHLTAICHCSHYSGRDPH